jgi:hypothetical protein
MLTSAAALTSRLIEANGTGNRGQYHDSLIRHETSLIARF